MHVLITDEKIKNQVKFFINNNINCNYTDFIFPIPNINFIKRDSLHKIKKGYSFLVNSFNSRHGIFILYKNEKDENKQYILFKNDDVIETDFACDDSYYENSIFEVFYENNKIKICDVFCCKGIKLNTYNFTVRYNNALFLDKSPDIECLSSFYNKELKENEEIYIIPENFTFLSKFNSCYKWREPKDVKFSLKLKNKENYMELYTSVFKNDVLFAKIYGDYFSKIKNEYNDDEIIDVKLIGNSIELNKTLNNYIYPTSLRIIENYISFVQEDIKIHDFFS